MDNRPIGMFDSGVGGLTVVKEVTKYLPNEEIVYFGDTARVPYGSKTKETITKYSRQIIKFLTTKDVKAVIIACNTASSNSLETMKEEFNHIPIIGVVESGVLMALNSTKTKKVGIIGTEGTIRSRAYEKLIHNYDSTIKVYSKACPLFVPLVEEGWTDGEIVELTVKRYLKDILNENIDTLVLGCTHYPLIIKCISKIVSDNIKLINPAVKTSIELKTLLDKTNSLRLVKIKPKHRFYVSDITTKFEQLSLNIFNEAYVPKKIDIDKY